MSRSPHQGCHNLQVLCLGHIAEDKLPNGAGEQGQDDPVGAQPGLVRPGPAWAALRNVQGCHCGVRPECARHIPHRLGHCRSVDC